MNVLVPVIDIDLCKDNLCNDQEFFSKMKEQFIPSFLDSCEELKSALSNKNLELIQKITHDLKSPLGIFGAKKILLLVNEIQIAANEKLDYQFNDLMIRVDSEKHELIQALNEVDKSF